MMMMMNVHIKQWGWMWTALLIRLWSFSCVSALFYKLWRWLQRNPVGVVDMDCLSIFFSGFGMPNSYMEQKLHIELGICVDLSTEITLFEEQIQTFQT